MKTGQIVTTCKENEWNRSKIDLFFNDRKNRRVYIYRPNQDVEILDNPETVGGDP
jgi:hypothetical protein